MKKALGIFFGFVLLLLLLTVLWALLAPKDSSDSDSTAGAERKNAVKVIDPCNQEGNTRKIYNLTFRNRQGQTMVIERLKFRNLNSEKGSVFVDLSYSPRRPSWADKKSNFRVIQEGRTNPPQFRAVTPPSKVPGEDAYRQTLLALPVVPGDVGIEVADPGEEPSNPLFLQISGFAPEPIVVGLLAPADCPVGQNNIEEEVDAPVAQEAPVQKQKAATKVAKEKKKQTSNKAKKKKQQKKQAQGG